MIMDCQIINQKISRENLGRLGIDDMAYIKSVSIEGQKFHAIHAADGTPLSVVGERDLAIATIRQFDLEPASVH